MQVRPATPADVERARECHRAAVRAFGPAAYDERQVEAWLGPEDAEADYPVDDPDHRFVVCVAEQREATDEASGDDRPASRETAGFGDLVVSEREVTAVYVHPDHAGHGVGSALLAHLEGRAREAGLAELTLESSLNAVGFYERAGYERVRDDRHEMATGVELPVVVMRKPLTENA